MELNDKVKETINNLKQKAERVRVQLNLGSMEARDEFEIQKKKMQEWLRENDISTESFKNLSSEQLEELKIKYKELREQLALGKAEGEEMLREQSKNIHKTINDIKYKIEKDEQFRNLKKESYEKLDELNDMFFVLNTKFKYDLEDGKDLWEEKKEEINKEFYSWSKELDELKEESTQKIDNFSEEISKAWKYFKKGF